MSFCFTLSEELQSHCIDIMAQVELMSTQPDRFFSNRYIIPANLNTRTLPKDLRDIIIYICHAMALQILNRRSGDLDDDGKVNLHSATLLKNCGRKYKAGINWLVDNNIIGVNHSYSRGRYSKTYWFLPPYNGETRFVSLKSRNIIEKEYTHVKVSFDESEANKEKSGFPEVYNWLVESQKRVRLTHVDYATLETLSIFKKGKTQHFSPHHKTQISVINNGGFRHTVCEYFRLHTSFTNLWTPLRKYMSINGETLRGCDISSSQVQFLLLTIAYNMGLGKFLYHSPSYSPFPHVSLDVCALTCLDSMTLLKPVFVCDKVALTEEYERASILLQKGLFYEDLQEKAGLTHLDRSTFKFDVFFAMFYGRNNYNYDNPDPNFHAQKALYLKFRENYPQIAAYLKAFKKQHGYEAPAREMQRVEANFVIKTVCGRLMRERPDMTVVTVHDSLYTTEDNFDFLIQVMKDEFHKLGVSPMIKEC